MSDCIGTTRKHREYDALLKRHKQLEQVARDMLDAIRISSSHHMAVTASYYETFVLQLEALGVEV